MNPPNANSEAWMPKTQKQEESKAMSIEDIKQAFYGDHDFVQTCPDGRGQHHPHGLVGKLWRINNPDTINIGSCFLAGRLKEGDLFLCIRHSGDCFQDYAYVENYKNCYRLKRRYAFGSYGIGDSTEVELSENILSDLINKERAKKDGFDY